MYDIQNEDLTTKRVDSDKTVSTITLRVVINEAGFTGLKEAWNRLTIAADTPVYISFDWLKTWWKHFGKHSKRKPYIILCYNNEQLIGIAPCYIGISKVGPFTLQKRLYLMGCGTSHNELLGFADDYGYSDFLDIIADPDYENAIAQKLFEYFFKNSEGFDKICFNHVRDDSFVVRKIFPLIQQQNISCNIVKTDKCAYIQLPDSLEKYISQLGSSSRRRRFRKKLKPVGKKYEVENVEKLSEAVKNVELLCSLHQEQWNSLGFPGLFFDNRQRNFFKEINEIAFRNGWLWFKICKDKEGVSALRWTLNYNNRFFDCYTAYSFTAPSAQHAPGLGLLTLLIKDAISMNATTVELLRGTERYKFDFTKKYRQNWKVTLNLFRYKSKLHSFFNVVLDYASKLYTAINNEKLLLKTHKIKAGPWKMFYSYSAFRINRLRLKFKS